MLTHLAQPSENFSFNQTGCEFSCLGVKLIMLNEKKVKAKFICFSVNSTYFPLRTPCCRGLWRSV